MTSAATFGTVRGQIGDMLYAGDGPGASFPVQPLIRFVNGEEAYLSNAHGGPRMFFNIEDHTSLSTGQEDVKFQVCSLPSPALARCCIACLPT